jgi:hypothetical protein
MRFEVTLGTHSLTFLPALIVIDAQDMIIGFKNRQNHENEFLCFSVI